MAVAAVVAGMSHIHTVAATPTIGRMHHDVVGILQGLHGLVMPPKVLDHGVIVIKLLFVRRSLREWLQVETTATSCCLLMLG